jgi:Cellulase (glycosyl hydrolase family 5)
MFVALAAAVVPSLTAVPAALSAPGMDVGFYDEGLTLGYPTDYGFSTLADLGADVLRLNLYWYEVAPKKPRKATNPNDAAYRWARYDQAIARAKQHGIEVIFSIFGTPRWANGGKDWQYAPKNAGALRAFAIAAAKRYPLVDRWLAWNEPNAPNFLRPQSRFVGGRWVFTSPGLYAPICNAIVDGVNAVDPTDTVACGLLNPRGKPKPNGRRDSVSPTLFLQGMKNAGAHPEVIAYHPYAWTSRIAPTSKVKGTNAITLGNFQVLVSAIDRLYGSHMRIWVTEYGYQTNPPDTAFGVPWTTQATYMQQAFGIMRAHPRIDLALWFQIKDDSRLAGWQSGVISTGNVIKPSYEAFRQIAGPG